MLIGSKAGNPSRKPAMLFCENIKPLSFAAIDLQKFSFNEVHFLRDISSVL